MEGLVSHACLGRRCREIFISGSGQRKNGLVNIAYTNRRRTITHVVLDPAKLAPSSTEMSAQWNAVEKTFESQTEWAAKKATA